MNTDFRVSVDFFSHHKARKLQKRLGAPGLVGLLRLWAYAAKVRTDGDLSGMDEEAVELAAEWDGEDGSFCAALLEVGFLDRGESGLLLHDWAENNAWAAEAVDRQDKARFSRLATVNRPAFDKLKATGVNAISKEDYARLTFVRRAADDRLTNASGPPTPAPSPAPKPEEKNTNTQSITGNKEPVRACDDSQGDFSDFSDAPGIEFQELRQFYDEHCRAEAPLTGFIEYKQLRASRRWPGISRICDAIDKHSRADPEGWKQFCPGLVKFLREHWWEKKPTARASPSRKNAGFDGTEADASARRVFEQRKAAREAANGGTAIQP